MKFLILIAILVFNVIAHAQVGKLGTIQEQMIRQSEGVTATTASLNRALASTPGSLNKMQLVEIIAARGLFLNLEKKPMTKMYPDRTAVYIHLYYRSTDGTMHCLVTRMLDEGTKVIAIPNYDTVGICSLHGSPILTTILR